MLIDLVRLLGQLPVKSGRGTLRLALRDGGEVGGELATGEGESRLTLNHPTLGVLEIGAGHVRLDATGQATPTVSTFPSGMLEDLLRRGIPTSFAPIQQLLQSLPIQDRALAKAVAAFGTLDVASVALAFPGITAFRARVGPLSLGPLLLPEIVADVSLRNLAVDLGLGHFACEIVIHDAEALDDVKLETAKLAIAVQHARASLSADVVYGLDGSHAAIRIAAADILAATGSGTLQSTAGDELGWEAHAVHVAVRDLYATRSQQGEVTLHAGELMVSTAAAEIQGPSLQVSTELTLQKPKGTLEGLAIDSRVEDGRFAGTLTLTKATFKVEEVLFAQLPAGFTTLTVGANPELLAAGVRLDLATQAPAAGFVGLRAGLTAFDATLNGLRLVATSEANELRVNGQAVLDDHRLSLQVKLPSVHLEYPDGKVDIQNVQFKYWHDAIMDALPQAEHAKFVGYARSAVIELGFGIGAFTIARFPEKRFPLSVHSGALKIIAEILSIFEQGHKDVSDVRRALETAAPFFDNPAAWAADLFKLVTFDRFGVDDFGLFIDIAPVEITFHPGTSGGDIIAFKLSTGIDGLGVFLKYHYWCPELFDLGKTCSGYEERKLLTSDIDISFIAEFQIFVDVAARRIVVQDVNFYPDTVLPDEVDRAITKAVSWYFGAEDVKRAIVREIAPHIPLGLPEQWDATRVTVDKQSGAIVVNVRALEHAFNSL